MKRKGRPLSSKNADDIETEDLEEGKSCVSESCKDSIATRKLPRRAAACINFKQKSIRITEDESFIEKKQYPIEDDECEAIRLTISEFDGPVPLRNLVDFIFFDVDGTPQPFEMCEISDIYISAIIKPMDKSMDKDKAVGVKCKSFGRIESWSLSGYDGESPEIRISTAISDYVCVKPAQSYRRFCELFYQKACVCVEVYKKLSSSKGGDPDLSVEELLGQVVRCMSESKGFPSGSSGLEFVASLGDFIYTQLIGLDGTSENDGVDFATLPALVALREQSIGRTGYSKLLPVKSDGRLKIEEGRQSEAYENEDEKLARLLQEEENWKLTKRQNSKRSKASASRFYIKINEDEIANDYPLPAYYKPSVKEMDEYIFSADDMCYYDLPMRTLSNWSLYNSDLRFISLELLPMKAGAENDVTIFGSGCFREGAESRYSVEVSPGQGSSTTSGAVDVEGVPVYLSAIKEWMIEFGSDMIFISIRTDLAWYRLQKPAKQYAPWFEPVQRTARLAISIIGLLKEQTRVSRLSFSDVVKKLSQFEKYHPAYISSDPSVVERYVVVHGQIIIQQFAELPDKSIQNCAFITGLSEKMEERHHTKLVLKKKLAFQKGANLNPTASTVHSQSKRKVMRATMTRLINRIWGNYYSNYLPEDSKQAEDPEQREEEELEEDQEENGEDEVEDEILSVLEESPRHHSSTKPSKCQSNVMEIMWNGQSTGNMGSGEVLYSSVIIHGDVIRVGAAVMVETSELEEEPTIVYVEYMFETPNGEKMIHGRMMKRGCHTVLGNAANDKELFFTNECMEFEMQAVKQQVLVDFRFVKWGYKHRKEQFIDANIGRAKEEEKMKSGLHMEYYCKSLYWPQRGAFLALPFDTMGLGNGTCHSCKTREQKEEFKMNLSDNNFVYNNLLYKVHDFVYIKPEYFGEPGDDQGTFKSGRNVGLQAYVVCHLLEINTPKGSKQPIGKSTMVKVRRFYRPEDVSAEKAYNSDIREIYYSEEILSLPVIAIEGKCEVRKRTHLPSLDLPVILDHAFFCEYSYDPVNGSIKQLPPSSRNQLVTEKTADYAILRKSKGKGKCVADEQNGDSVQLDCISQGNRLATLDIFAGCGGLSEGLQLSGISCTKWAIEYEEPAGEAFGHNHPEATVFIDNCNVILRAIMEVCGDAEDCISTAEATEFAAKLDEEKRKKLPLPGQVDFINGGPPCQGFSGMNRFNQSTWSKVQCEMILAFLSFADYFRPRFFLLENVRNFVSFNRGQTFRLTLASLLEMGYQVRFGILEAGTFGVSQSRKRAFIWAASPEETLPEWPEPMHVFAGSELKVSLPGCVQYAAVRSTAGGAAFRPITVRDTIGDLPPVLNGASRPDIEYGSNPVSWFQKQIRGKTVVLRDHISKEMNELNLVRCQHIPRRPGADWRDLPEEKVKLSTGQMVDLIPWCLPNTAKRHNQWKGLFGRVYWEGNFPTSITDPQPMGKVGMCFHPEQDRILTVRECARSQGFPDSYYFSGNIQSKHRQIGNAVPPPLAYALGRKLKEVFDAKHSSD